MRVSSQLSTPAQVGAAASRALASTSSMSVLVTGVDPTMRASSQFGATVLISWIR
ncbi:hypothetical protein [Kutzneria sp. 744]|uniref:hypothetical protein n=1 Tax=Kutzneria sp. (strain 744) TaxID=345341 RepID=UPI0012FCE52B|nr:hypothetical protein [Kutzneria sp. 744]